MRSKINIFVLAALFYASSLYAGYSRAGIIETLREDGYVTVLFDSVPVRDVYYIVINEKIIGSISSLKQIPDVYGKKRYFSRCSLADERYREILRPGIEIVSIDTDKEIDKRLQKNPYIETIIFKPEIVSLIDKREMLLIPEGKFLMGCPDCSDDESPEHIVFLGNYYIDKYEVSNSDYKKYADIKGLPYPDYWKEELDSRKNFKSAYFGSLPVIVTYYEAADYASWAGKRLPGEEEWEKASRPPAALEIPGKSVSYSWGSSFKEGIANTEELWSSDKTGENLKKIICEKFGFKTLEKGYVPVDITEKESLSYYGVAQLDGNALEWTDSWYQPYPGNKKENKKYGKQYKVIRGGAYYLPKMDSRITDRKTGGMPDLYKDRIAGFRCVKNTAESDKK